MADDLSLRDVAKDTLKGRVLHKLVAGLGGWLGFWSSGAGANSGVGLPKDDATTPQALGTNSLAHGPNAKVLNTGMGIALGPDCQVGGVFGGQNGTALGSNNRDESLLCGGLMAGSNNLSSGIGGNNLNVGNNNQVSGFRSAAVGSDNVVNSIGGAWGFGRFLDLQGAASFGYGNTTRTGPLGQNSLAGGAAIAEGADSILIGGSRGLSDMAVGLGRQHIVGNLLFLGSNVPGLTCGAGFGFANQVLGHNSFANGSCVDATRNWQRAWGSNRSLFADDRIQDFLIGLAQKSGISLWTRTDGATARNMPFGFTKLAHDSPVGGPFQRDEVVTGGTSGATGAMMFDSSSNVMYVNQLGDTPFQSGEVLTGSVTGATANTTAAPVEQGFTLKPGQTYRFTTAALATNAVLAGEHSRFDGVSMAWRTVDVLTHGTVTNGPFPNGFLLQKAAVITHGAVTGPGFLVGDVITSSSGGVARILVDGGGTLTVQVLTPGISGSPFAGDGDTLLKFDGTTATVTAPTTGGDAQTGIIDVGGGTLDVGGADHRGVFNDGDVIVAGLGVWATLTAAPTLGTATLDGTTLTRTAGTGGSDTISAQLVLSGDDVHIEVTGKAASRYEWFADFIAHQLRR